jgi:SAM-dependent methyltransferase
MDWENKFYSTTGKWWGPAEAQITDRDQRRVTLLKRVCPHTKTLLELGCGYGTTAALTADAGFDVVANELSERIRFAKRFEGQKFAGSLKFVKGDFYQADLGSNYDVVTYWNGFGIGSDADQRRLLTRIAKGWLAPGGKALIDIGNPFVRAKWAGDREHKDASPERGYAYTIDELTNYDPIQNRFTDTWWETGKENQKLTQTLRNYTPADLMLLLENTGLQLETIFVAGKPLDVSKDHIGNSALLSDEQEYLAVLSHS